MPAYGVGVRLDTPTATQGRGIRTARERFWLRVNTANEVLPVVRPELGPCHLWEGSKNPRGYGQIRIDDVLYLAHRVAVLIAGEELPDDLTVDHLCMVHACVRRSHLEIVTNAENNRRGGSESARNARKTHCPSGHPYNRAKPNGSRYCTLCENERMRRRSSRLKEAR